VSNLKGRQTKILKRWRLNSSGSLAMLAAIRRASSRRVSRDQHGRIVTKSLERLTVGLPLLIQIKD
jgi:hypothetical protein